MNAVAEVRRARAEGLRPDPVLLVSEWSDRHRILPKKSSAEPGPWRTSRTPFLREPMDALSSTSTTEEVILMFAAQMGKSEALLNFLGYIIDHSPGPTILVQPIVELGKRFSRQRVDPLISATPCLQSKVSPARSRDSGNTVLSKEFLSGQLIITGANSAAGLRSMPAQYALLDEIDAYPLDVDEEGAPVDLVEARQRTFARRKRVKASTPTIQGRSAIEEAYLASDQRRYYVPCPDCGEMQPLEFSRLVWSKLGLPPEQAVYECRACFYGIFEHEKTAMLARGEWRPENLEAVGKVRGYHLNALYAPLGWISWGDIASKFVKVHRNPQRYRVFVNTVLGETWKETGEAPDWKRLYERREAYKVGTVPDGVLFLTAAADVQHDRILVEVVGWGRGKVSWSIDWLLLPGETADISKGPWLELTAMLNRTYPRVSGGDMPISVLAVDSGDQTQTVYSWTRRHPFTRVIAVKGFAHGGMLLGAPTLVETTVRGRKVKSGTRMRPVAVNLAKDELYGWLRLEAPTDEERANGVGDPEGYCHFPQYPEEYFKELTAEQVVTARNRRGYQVRTWQVIPGRQNHTLDARVYARAAASHAGMDRLSPKQWDDLENQAGTKKPTTPPGEGQPEHPAPAVATPEPQKPRPQVQRGWLGKRRGNWLKGR